jgi:hypothetical protein
VKRILIWIIVLAVLAIVFVLYRSRSASRLDVPQDAQREIERAKQR